jgi:UMP-CMP kinase
MCGKIVDEFNFVHLSAGDLLRAELASGSANAELIQTYIDDGKIVPVEITVTLIKNAMKEAIAATVPKNRFLVDGFPRNEDNLHGWTKVRCFPSDLSCFPHGPFPDSPTRTRSLFLSVCLFFPAQVMEGFANVKFVLFMDCDEETMEKRCLGRAEGQGRSDDNVETIRKRFHTYVNSTRPIIELFEQQKLVKTIDARPAADVVFAAVKAAFADFA